MIYHEKSYLLLHKNKASGNYFIFIKQSSDDEGLFITPPTVNGEVRVIPLKYDLFFDDTVSIRLEDPQAKKYLHDKQIAFFRDYATTQFKRMASGAIQKYNSYTKKEVEMIKSKGGELAELIRVIELLIKSGAADKHELLRD